MRLFRGLLVVFFLGLIVFGLREWYQSDNQVQNTDLVTPAWERITRRVDNTAPSTSKILPNSQGSIVDSITTPNNSDNSNNQSLRLHPDVTTGTLPLSTFESIIENTRSIGPARSDYALLVYCDFDSIYCQQMYEQGAIRSYQLTAQDNLSIYFQGYTTTIDGLESTYNAQHARLCAERLANAPQLSALQVSLFELPYQTTEQLVELGEELGIEGFAGCLLTESTRETLLAKNLQAKNLFSIRSLPSLVFYKKNTQQWFLIPGLYSNEELSSTFSIIFDRQ